MKITVLGAGKIGATIGSKWAARGHHVTFGIRDATAEKTQTLLAKMEGDVQAVPLSDACGDTEAVLLAIPGMAVINAVTRLKDQLAGKILIDATNNVNRPVMHSLDVLRQRVPDASLFRAFNSLGWENFAEPEFRGVQADLFYCGDEGPARPVVESLIQDVGLRPIYIGALDQAALLDSLTLIWFALALKQGYGRHVAFKLLQP